MPGSARPVFNAILPKTTLSAQVPFEDHISDNVVLTKGNGVLAAFSVAGVYPGTTDTEDASRWFGLLHNAIRNIAAEDVELTTYQCRMEATGAAYRRGRHTNEFSSGLDDAYLENLRDRYPLWSNRLFLMVEMHAPSKAARATGSFFSDVTADPRAEINARVERLNDICDLLVSHLGKEYGLKRLGYVTRNSPVIFDEIAEAIVGAMTGVQREIPATTGRMGNSMFSETVRFRNRQIEFHGAGDTSFARIFGFKEYPMVTWPGMFHSLSTAPYRHTLMQSFRILANGAAMDVLTRKQNRMLIADDKAKSQIAALDLAADELMNREWVLGDHSLLLIAFADTRKAMADVGNAAWRDMASCGLTVTQMSAALTGAFLSMLPHGGEWRPRPGFVKSRNFVAFSPFYNWPAGVDKARWGGPPIAVLRTEAGTPYGFDWFPAGSDLGNTLITGMPGSGKTLGAGTLLAMTAGRARVVALDHKRGWDFLIREMGGDYAVLGAGEPHFAPLKALEPTPGNIEFLTDLISGCIGGVMLEEEKRRLDIALETVMSLPAADRSLGEVRAFFDDEPEGAGCRLAKWCRGNALGWVIDAPADTVRFGGLSGMDVTALLENPRARGPAMCVLFHRIGLCLDGTPTLVPMDEGWRALLDDTFRANIEKQLRTIRSKNGVVVFITQSPADIVESGIARVLTEMCGTQMHFANPRGTRDDYVTGLKLTEGQFEAQHALQPGEGWCLLIQGTGSVVVHAPMHGLDRYIGILSAREADLTLADRL